MEKNRNINEYECKPNKLFILDAYTHVIDTTSYSREAFWTKQTEAESNEGIYVCIVLSVGRVININTIVCVCACYSKKNQNCVS